MADKVRFKLSIKPSKRGAKHPEIKKVQKYLTRFGYLQSVTATGTLDKATSDALTNFQRFFNIKQTGDLSTETIKNMEALRCGNDDLPTADSPAGGGTHDNFELRGCKYNQRNFTYRFVNGTADISGTDERNAVRNAFDTWASVLCGVTFQERTSGQVDFEIGWFTGSHGDGSPFDGTGGATNTLAHAFYPPPCGGAHAGSLHFDDAESWSLNGAGTTLDTETVALHEIGHLLGLAHSSVSGSVMFPSYGGVRRNLTQDDIDGIRRLYPFLCRRGDSGGQAGFIGEIAAVRHRTRQILNAARTQSGNLKLIAWSVGANGSISRTGDSGNQAGRASSISIAKNPSSSTYVTAVRTSSGNLKLISWDLNSSGTNITRKGDSGSQAGRATMINIGAVRDNRFVTAVRTSSNRLKLINWRLNGNGSLTRLSDSGNAAGVVGDISMVTLSGNRVVTPVRTQSGNLKLINWRVNDTSISRLGDSGSQAGNARNIRATVDQFGHIVTAVKQSNNDLKLIVWKVNSAAAIQRLGDSGSLAGRTRGHDISIANGDVVTAVRTSSGNLKVIVWNTTSSGAVSRVGDSDGLAGNATLITLADELSGAPPIVTSVRTTTNNLKLISWSTA